MAERVVAASTPWIAASKFVAAQPRRGAVERERLLNRLGSATDVPVVLVSASAGYGKSTLAAQWRARCKLPVVWVNLDRSDNDSSALLNTMVVAFHLLDPGAPGGLDDLKALGERRYQGGFETLAEALERRTPFELILDDTHLLNDPRSLGILGFVLERMGPGSQMMLVTQVDPHLPLARRRALGELLEIRADELALNADESRALAGPRVSQEALERLHERTEGWPAGLALGLQALPESVTADQVTQLVTGTQREIADYFVEVILDRLPAPTRRFLLATSVLTRVTAPLCDAILEVSSSSETLAELEHSNSFVVALDNNRRWYRYHHLFAELLRSELDRSEPELAATYLRRAAEWYERNNEDPAEGFRCAHESGDLERAGRFALGAVEEYAQRGRLETMRLWLDDCTEAELAADPQLALAKAWVSLLLGEHEQAHYFAGFAQRGDRAAPSAAAATSHGSAVASFRAALAPNGIHEMLHDAEIVLNAERDASARWLFGGLVSAGIAKLLLGKPHESVKELREALTLTDRKPELAHVQVLCLAYLAFALTDLESHTAARKAAQEAVALSTTEVLDQTLAGSVARTARATVLVHRGDFDRAAAALTDARTAGAFVRGSRWLSADMSIRWGSISFQLGDRLAAELQADVARAALHGYPDAGVLPDRLAKLDRQIASLSDLHFTPAEIRILAFLPTHLSIKEIAALLHVSTATVKTHVSSVYSKLDASTRSDAVEAMQELGLDLSGVARKSARIVDGD